MDRLTITIRSDMGNGWLSSCNNLPIILICSSQFQTGNDSALVKKVETSQFIPNHKFFC